MDINSKKNQLGKGLLLQIIADCGIWPKERFLIIEQFFDDRQIDFLSVTSIVGNILSKIISLIYLFDYASIYRAILSEIDPSPVKSIDYIKRKIWIIYNKICVIYCNSCNNWDVCGTAISTLLDCTRRNGTKIMIILLF